MLSRLLILSFGYSLSCRNHGSHFEAHKAAFEEGAARDDALIEDSDSNDNSESKHVEDEKA